jgi:hypothetical protein
VDDELEVAPKNTEAASESNSAGIGSDVESDTEELDLDELEPNNEVNKLGRLFVFV